MDGTTLSPRERQLLAALEAELRVDLELDLRLRTMRRHQVRAVLGPPCRVLLAALLTLPAVLAGVARLGWVGATAAAASVASVTAVVLAVLTSAGPRMIRSSSDDNPTSPTSRIR
ncbi:MULTISPECIES: hypothetical protein [Kitasatospora]|uniref:DUF3040 domain-containing protein n=1 Tax=Kitasatospora setae (strain ATCC 33774 / DSM 43861 / JCM 3304 / KCC A-0304 / NBRC 14216 / KM-6054) TaxID=452652 RepID=E4N5U4_KITSK|nr:MULTISPECIES: hypothetical protein [Kitasatospora]BAJ26575.1 hypothetical protein KSE_07350 [Kitasatospora setae KM-6054]